VWMRVARTVRAVPRREPPPAPSDGIADPAGGAMFPRPASVAAAVSGPPASGRLADVSSQRRIRRGQTAVDAQLDLHGHTQDTAYRELIAFIDRERRAGSRCVLIITGKGRLGAGVLRARFLDWIASSSIRPLLAGYSRAHPRHGGEGAFYLLLKAAKS